MMVRFFIRSRDVSPSLQLSSTTKLVLVSRLVKLLEGVANALIAQQSVQRNAR